MAYPSSDRLDANAPGGVVTVPSTVTSAPTPASRAAAIGCTASAGEVEAGESDADGTAAGEDEHPRAGEDEHPPIRSAVAMRRPTARTRVPATTLNPIRKTDRSAIQSRPIASADQTDYNYYCRFPAEMADDAGIPR